MAKLTKKYGNACYNVRFYVDLLFNQSTILQNTWTYLNCNHAIKELSFNVTIEKKTNTEDKKDVLKITNTY